MRSATAYGAWKKTRATSLVAARAVGRLGEVHCHVRLVVLEHAVAREPPALQILAVAHPGEARLKL